MTPYYQDDLVTLLQGSVLEVLAQLPENSVHCVATSPPYWSKRNYHADGQIGLETSLEEYVAKMVAVFREVRRVLRDDGVCFVNLGDTIDGERKMVPERVVFGMEADGWIFKQVMIWAKDNPLPESVNGTRWEPCRVKVASGMQTGGGKMGLSEDTRVVGLNERWNGVEGAAAEYKPCPGCPKCAANDGLVLVRGAGRATTSHEYIYHFAKTPLYYWNTEAVREGLAESTKADRRNGTGRHTQGEQEGTKYESTEEDKPSWYRAKQFVNPSTGRNLRSVWTFPTQGSSYKHFAMFPERLPEICIKAATSPVGVCPSCGAQYAPIVSREILERLRGGGSDGGNGTDHSTLGGQQYKVSATVLGYRATCACAAGPAVPATVLDPFCGAGTTNLVARRLSRKSIGIDLSLDYLKISVDRLNSPRHSQMELLV